MNILKKISLRRLSLVTFLSLISICSIIISISIIGYFSIKLLKSQKTRDVWAITFLNFEHESAKLSQNISALLINLGAHEEYNQNAQMNPDVSLLVKKDNSVELLKGVLPLALKSQILNAITAKSSFAEIFYQNGIYYLLKSYPEQLTLKDHYPAFIWQITSNDLLGERSIHSAEALVYLLNRRGDVIMANRTDFPKIGAMDRPLVQYFVKLPLTQGQIEFIAPSGNRYHGFYSEIKNTNLIFFAEISEQFILGKIAGFVHKVSLAALISIFIALFITHLGFRKLKQSIHELIAVAARIARGDFVVSIEASGIGEIKLLGEAFQQMSDSLLERDRSIRDLMLEQKEKARLEDELQIAKEIQNNLLPTPQSLDPHLIYQCLYAPAAHVAGDWFACATFADTQRTIFAIGDVSGHGAGPSMFTAVAAALFEEERLKSQSQFDAKHFLTTLNHVMHNIGKGQWHITLLIAIIDTKEKSVEFYNAGHLFPIIIEENKEEKSKIISPSLPSDPIGLSSKANIATKKHALKVNTAVIFYTDGLTEAKNKEQISYGKKRLRKVIENLRIFTPDFVLKAITQDWKMFLDDDKADDDCCIIAVRIKSNL